MEPGRSSWTAPLDARRLAPGEDAAEVTAAQVRQVVTGLVSAGQWRPGDPGILVVADAGYDAPRLAYLLADLPVAVLARMRSDRVLRRTAVPQAPGVLGRPRRHGGEFVFGDPGTWGAPEVTTTTSTRLYGPAIARSWNRLHPRLTHRSAWVCQDGPLPVIEGTVIRLEVARLPSGAIPKPCPKIRDPEAADRWTWLILAAYTQLRLARPLAADLRRPWEQPAPPHRLTPARVRRGFRNIRTKAAQPAGAPKPGQPGQAGRQDRRTAAPPPATTCTSSLPARPGQARPASPAPAAQVKDQARPPFLSSFHRSRSGSRRRPLHVMAVSSHVPCPELMTFPHCSAHVIAQRGGAVTEPSAAIDPGWKAAAGAGRRAGPGTRTGSRGGPGQVAG